MLESAQIELDCDLQQKESICKKFSGGVDIYNLSFHAVPSIKKKPRVFILHTRVNDFREEKDYNEIAKKIAMLATTMKTDDNTVYISGIIKRNDDKMNERISTVNNVLKGLCRDAGFLFIDNNNIELRHHLNRRGLHLNRFGDSKLAFNIISALRH